MTATSPPGARTPRWGVGLLVAGGLLSSTNGVAHVLLPVVYPWGQRVEGLYDPVRWALFATTVFFAVLLTLCGALTVWVARAPGIPARVVVAVAAGMAGFWTVGAVYELAVPFPAPGAEWALPAFSVTAALLHATGLWFWLRARAPASGRDRIPDAVAR